jgi:hypothetical protein
MPEDVRKSFKSLRGFTGKAEGETQQCWIDSARELGLSNAAETSGIRFYRKPTVFKVIDVTNCLLLCHLLSLDSSHILGFH